MGLFRNATSALRADFTCLQSSLVLPVYTRASFEQNNHAPLLRREANAGNEDGKFFGKAAEYSAESKMNERNEQNRAKQKHGKQSQNPQSREPQTLNRQAKDSLEQTKQEQDRQSCAQSEG